MYMHTHVYTKNVYIHAHVHCRYTRIYMHTAKFYLAGKETLITEILREGEVQVVYSLS